MESQGSPAKQNLGRGAIPHPSTMEFCAQRPPIPPSSFFHGFGGAGNPMPFLYPNSFMPPIPGFGFGSPPKASPSTTTDLTEGSLKRGPKESVIHLSNTSKKRRAPRKKVEVVELDDTKDDVDLQRNSCHWKDHWVIQLVTLRGEMQNTFSAPPKQGVDNWSRLHTKLASLCPDFTKDSEACRKKWTTIYNDYKEDKAMNMRSGSQRSEKCRWYLLVDEFMSDRAHVVAHAHASASKPHGPSSTTDSDTRTMAQKSGETTSKSPEPKHKEDIFFERCLSEMRESTKLLMDSMKASEKMKMVLLMSMQKTMEKMVDKL